MAQQSICGLSGKRANQHRVAGNDLAHLGRCVLGEMYNRSPVLQGETDRDQLFKIFGRVGRPNDESFPGWNKLPGFPESVGYAWDKVPEDKSMMNSARGWGYAALPLSIGPRSMLIQTGWTTVERI